MAGSGCGRAALGGAQLAGAQRSSSWGSGTMGHPLFTHAKAELWKQSMGLLSGAIAQTVLLSCSLRKFCPISPFSRHLRKSQGLCPSLTRRDPSLAKRILLLLLLLLAALPAGDLLTKACDKNSPGFITHAVGMPKQNRGGCAKGAISKAQLLQGHLPLHAQAKRVTSLTGHPGVASLLGQRSPALGWRWEEALSGIVRNCLLNYIS